MSFNEVVPGLVSTVIPVYNRAHLLRRAVESVLAQTWRSIEVVISDDGSTDDTGEVVAALVREHPGVVRYVTNGNRGPGPAREAGRQLARGEFLQYLDSDDLLLREKFERQIDALRARPDCGVAYGWTRILGRPDCDPEVPAKWTGRALDALFPSLLVDRWWCTVSPLYRRTVTDAVGPWSDLRYSQDWEYDARVGALGVRLAYVPCFVAEQYHHDGVRQTGHGRWLTHPDKVRFFRSLDECARRAGVDPNCPEARHFSRWVFAHARACALGGADREAESLLELAMSCTATVPADMRCFYWLKRVAGWSHAARIADVLRRAKGGPVGTDTLQQSWMDS